MSPRHASSIQEFSVRNRRETRSYDSAKGLFAFLMLNLFGLPIEGRSTLPMLAARVPRFPPVNGSNSSRSDNWPTPCCNADETTAEDTAPEPLD
jgi:hypothetical protein